MHTEFLNIQLFIKYALNDWGNITLLFCGKKNIGQCWKWGVIALGREASQMHDIRV
jgi:hypothetical protein